MTLPKESGENRSLEQITPRAPRGGGQNRSLEQLTSRAPRGSGQNRSPEARSRSHQGRLEEVDKIVHWSRSHQRAPRGSGENSSRKQNTPKIPSRYGYTHVADLPSPDPDDLGMEGKTALTEITSLLTSVVQRVERMETELHQ